jgi:hypothetical protein
MAIDGYIYVDSYIELYTAIYRDCRCSNTFFKRRLSDCLVPNTAGEVEAILAPQKLMRGNGASTDLVRQGWIEEEGEGNEENK